MKKKIFMLTMLAVAALAVIFSCVKDLEDEGVYKTTEYRGTVVEKSTMAPIKGVQVQVTDGTHVHASTTTDNNGKFVLKNINFDEVSKNYYLWLDGSDIDLPSVQEELCGLGRKVYDYKMLILYDKTNVNLLPVVYTNEISNVKSNSASVRGTAQSDGGHTVSEKGICYARHQTPTVADPRVSSGPGLGVYTGTLSGLSKNTTYYVRAYATNSIGTVYGAQRMFTTRNGVATITTTAATELKATSAVVGGTITDDGGARITARGVCWGVSANPTVSGDHTTDGQDTGAFTHRLQNLNVNTTYYYRAYATNSCGTTYGTQKTLTTTNGLPLLTTNTVSNITATTAACGGNITDNGGFNVTARGVCWNTQGNPDVNSQHTTNGSGNGSFNSNMSGLTPGTLYHVRAYATNSMGTSYGSERTFTTSGGSVAITISTPTNITATSASCSANITNDGGATVTERGICWSTTQSPTTSGTHERAGSGTGSFSAAMTGLTPGTTYYVRAYAVNAAGTHYSSQVTFSTLNGSVVFTISNPTNITATSASCTANITNDGGATVTARGVCWSTAQYPTVSGSHSAAGTGTGSFTVSVSGLSPATTYYVRAYATNAAGTSYSSQVSFTTTSGLPTVTTGAVSNITANTATCSGNVTSTGGFTVTAKGFCWSTAQYPTVSGNHNNVGSGTGAFNGSLTNLQRSTTYYVRAYATNSNGTVYGEQVNFTTRDGLPSVTTTAPTFSGTTAVSGGNVTSDGGFAVTARGVCYGSYPNPDLTSNYTHTTDGSGVGYYTSSFSLPGGVGYIRAYATNANGTSYGQQYVVTPYDTLPTFTYDGHTYRVAPCDGTRRVWNEANSYCRGMTLYGYSDWRLPTLGELQQMYIDRVRIGGFDASEYWSSSRSPEPYQIGLYYYVSFSNGSTGLGGTCFFRPIRMEN